MKKLSQIIASSALLAAVMTSPVSAAGSATLSLSPSSGSYVQGVSFSVTVTETGDNVNVVTAKLTYDASKLTCNSVSGGAAFGGNVSTTCGGGTVTISRYVEAGSPAVNGSQVVGTVNFTAAATGTATVSTAAGSQIASAGSNIWNSATTSASFTLTAPATTGGQGGEGTTTGSGSTAPKSTSTTPKSTAKAATSNTAKTAAPTVAGEATQPAESAPAPAPEATTTAPEAVQTVADTAASTVPTSNAPTWVSGIAVAAAVSGAGYLTAKRNPSLIEKAKSMIPSKGNN